MASQSTSKDSNLSQDLHNGDATQDSDSSENHHLDAEDPLTSPQPSSSKKKKKKKSKAAKALGKLTGRSDGIPQELVDQVFQEVKNQGVEGSEDLTEEGVRKVLSELKIADVVKGKAGIGGYNRKDMGEHRFWSTQPVPQPSDGPPLEDGYIEPSKPRDQVRQEPYTLPQDFEWSILDIDDPNQIKEVYDLLTINYIEDDDASFRFQYSAEFLYWALRPPGYFKEWHLGVRHTPTRKLVAFISGVPMTLRVRKNTFQVCEINYLCVLKKLRSKRLAPVLIKEVTRQVHLQGVFQAIYTAGVVVPTPLTVCRYNHRPLNVQKLVDVRFSYIPRNMTLARMIRHNKLPETTTLSLREMEERDVPQVAALYSKYMKRFDMAPVMTINDVSHQLVSGKGKGEIGATVPGRRERQVTWSYVVEDLATKKITDFFSFFSLPSTIIKHPTYNTLEAAYLYYYATDTAFNPGADEDGSLKQRLTTLISDATVIAHNAKFDVFNALTLMDNALFLRDLKFGVGDGYLNYYLYNWRTAPLAGMQAVDGVPEGRGVGVVML